MYHIDVWQCSVLSLRSLDGLLMTAPPRVCSLRRGEDGKMREGGLEKALECIDEALALTSFCGESST